MTISDSVLSKYYYYNNDGISLVQTKKKEILTCYYECNNYISTTIYIQMFYRNE